MNEDGSVVSPTGGEQGEGIFGGIGEEAAREATKAKTSKVFKEVSCCFSSYDRRRDIAVRLSFALCNLRM